MRKAMSLFAAIAVGMATLGASAVPAQAVSPVEKPSASTMVPPKPSKKDKVVNPNPPKVRKALPTRNGVVESNTGGYSALIAPSYSYAVAEETQTSTGMVTETTVENPWLSGYENHTLWELAVCKGTGSSRNCIEIGWTKDNSSSVCAGGNSYPCLFVGYWKNGVFQGYNGGAGYHDYSGNAVNAGSSLSTSVGSQRNFRIQYDAANSVWWVAYNLGWIGWIDGSEFPTFTTGTSNQAFGEVVSTTRTQGSQCTDMLSITLPTASPAAGHRTWSLDLLSNATAENFNMYVSPTVTGRAAVKISNTEARLGGPGPC